MSHDSPTSTSPGRAALWTGRILSGFIALGLTMSAAMKFMGGPDMAAALAPIGLPASLLVTLGVIELSCVLLYVVPQTAVLGAILMTGYLGGAMFAHIRVGEPFIAPLILGIVAWAGLFLRDPRLRRLLPLRFV